MLAEGSTLPTTEPSATVGRGVGATGPSAGSFDVSDVGDDGDEEARLLAQLEAVRAKKRAGLA